MPASFVVKNGSNTCARLVGVDAGAGVGHDEVCTRWPRTTTRDRERAAVLHRLEGVHDQVEDHLLELLGIADEHAVVRQLALDPDPAGRGRSLLEVEHVVDQLAEVHGLADAAARARQLEELA